ncbi:MAG TPA: glycosyltransferase family 4 protein [Candidatus Corynebacterium gallistercoris]|uniref:Glycosyltransferase family 4 protein n=1 Tax=Candidatus Corynebacterium gallistercoris TaxID=2838530 RepID=A0A9D1UR49_9CORY|nr:glycosyltransferase family 4 protein [Candidatus Corynebacterium gallistercoris]
MRIGMVCPYSFDEPGGVQIHAIELCAELQRRGHSVSLIGPGEPSAELPEFVEPGGASVPIRYNGSVARLSFGPRTRSHIRRWIKANDFDVLHIHEPNSPSYSMLALTQVHGPVVATYHASASGSRLLKIVLPVLRPLLERIQGGIAVSEEARRWQVENLAGDPVLIPNGVDTKVYTQAQRVAEWDASRPRLMFLGRFDEPRKGLQVLLGAMPEIVAKFPQSELLIAGGGDVRELEQRLEALGLSHHTGWGPSSATVRILGRISDADKARALASSDIYVAPNTGGESFGIVLVEGMAAGATVVASDLAAFSAVGQQGAAAALFSNGDSADLSRVITSLLSDESARHELADRGRSRAQDFDWSTVADQVEQVYAAVVTEGRKVELS